MIEFDDSEDAGGGAGWLATFADLMSLLMCFFVLLLSFSEMDLEKYKQIAGSMKEAFGVQNEVKATGIPKGTSVIAREFSPGKPENTPINVVRQQTIDSNKQTLDVLDRKKGTEFEKQLAELTDEEALEVIEKRLEKLLAETQADADRLSESLKEEIEKGMIDVATEGRSITIRIRELGSFGSASATLRPGFLPVLNKMRTVLTDVEGQVAIEGHTDSIPISTAFFKSNWGLSASRALSVMEELRKGVGKVEDGRFVVVAHADNKPLLDNLTRANRAANRRVEIIVRQGMDAEISDALRNLQQSNPDILKTVEVGSI